jgi:hypothetical protein
MGLSGGGTTTTVNTPPAQSTAAAGTLAGVYNQQAPAIQGYANQIGSLVPSLLDKYNAGNPAINAQQKYITDTLGHPPGQNPQLDELLRNSDAQVGNQTAASLGTRGISPAGSVASDVVSRNIGQNDTALRFQDYQNQEQLQAQAAGQAPSNAAGQVVGIAPLLGATETAAGLPLNAATQYAGGIGGLLGSYGTQQQTKPDNFGSFLGTVLSTAGKFAAASDVRLKDDIRRVGMTDGGLPVYTFRYKGEDEVRMGVMAQDVAAMQPGALGPERRGMMTVKYWEVQ